MKCKCKGMQGWLLMKYQITIFILVWNIIKIVQFTTSLAFIIFYPTVVIANILNVSDTIT